MTKVLLVTPVLNGEKLIERTLQSILAQELPPGVSITYIIADGGSTDSTTSCVENMIASHSHRDKASITVSVVQASDNGMYDALATQFSNNGNDHDIYGYINAGDYYSPYAIAVASNALKNHAWITGLLVTYDKQGILNSAKLPWKYDRALIRSGYYGTILPYIQQESIFWTHRLHKKIDFATLRNLKLAGDFYLWFTFAKHEPLSIVRAWLGGFAEHEGQLSKIHRQKYLNEMNSLADPKTLFKSLKAYAHKLAWNLPGSLKLRFNKNIIHPQCFN